MSAEPRAARRAADVRAKVRARGWLSRWRASPPDAREVGLYAATPARCSGPCCSHTRRHHGPAVSEVRRLPAPEEMRHKGAHRPAHPGGWDERCAIALLSRHGEAITSSRWQWRAKSDDYRYQLWLYRSHIIGAGRSHEAGAPDQAQTYPTGRRPFSSRGMTDG